MSVKKMLLMNVIGKVEDVDDVLKDLLETKKVSPTSAIAEIEKNNFLLDVNEENVDRLVDLSFVHYYKRNKKYEEILLKSTELKQILKLEDDKRESKDNLNMSQEEISKSLIEIYEEVKTHSTMITALKKEVTYLENFHTNSFKELTSLETTIDDLRNMEYFVFKIGILSKEDRIRLKNNYESILAILVHAGSSPEGEVFLIIYPKNQDAEISRILRSLYFKEIVIPKSYTGTTKEILEEIQVKEENLLKEIKNQEEILGAIKEKNQEKIKYLLNQISLLARIDSAKEEIAISDHYFYFSAWIAKSDKETIGGILRTYSDIFIIFKDETELNTPTNIRSNRPLKRFRKNPYQEERNESFVNKYDDERPVKRLGHMLHELNHESVDVKQRHEEELKMLSMDGQKEVKKLEESLLKTYMIEAEKAYQDALNEIGDDTSSKDLSYYDKVISDVEEVYEKVKPDIITSLWEEILSKEE